MNEPAIGFVGFGEAGFHIAEGLRSAGISRISAFDINRDTPDLGGTIRRRAEEAEVRLLDSSGELTASAEILFSTVTCACAKQAAEQTAPFLRPHHIYADLNSVSPALKQEIERAIDSAGAGFVEAAVMSPVPPHGHRAPMLLGGKAAARFAERMKGTIRGSELLIFEGCAHAPIYEKVEEFNQKTLQFLQRHTGAHTAKLAGSI